MSMEQSMPVNRPEDFEAAEILANEHPILKEDVYTKRVLERGMGDNGEPISDIGNFLVARAAWLEKEDAEIRLAAAENKDRRSYDAAVISGVRGDIEKNIEGGK